MQGPAQVIEGATSARGVARYRRISAALGGFILAEASWASCLGLVAQLEALGIEAYCPVIRERRRSEKRGTVETRTPAFGGYFWLANQAAVRIPNRLENRFRRFYRDGFYWFSVDEVDHMRELEAGWPALRPDSHNRARFAKGSRIEVVAGPFQGKRGLVQSDSGARVKVSLGGFIIDLPPFMVIADRAACANSQSL